LRLEIVETALTELGGIEISSTATTTSASATTTAKSTTTAATITAAASTTIGLAQHGHRQGGEQDARR
jgi:hypothetical protein